MAAGVTPARQYPAFDGLRAVAVIGVLLSHGDERTWSLGWSGVILFFVLSGFLITGLLLDAKGADPRYFRNFYARRALRIFPVYYLVLAMTVLFVAWLVPGSRAAILSGPFSGDWGWFAVYLQNYTMPTLAPSTPLPRLLAHTWSLAVEEQFYLLWPAVVWCCSRRALAATCLVMLVAGPASRSAVFAWSGNPFLALAALPGQCDALAAGALLALLVRRSDAARFTQPAPWLAALAVSGLLLGALVAATGWQSYASPRVWMAAPGNWALLPLMCLAFAALLMAALRGTGRLGEVLRTRPLAHLGRISYGLYLYHPLVFAATNAAAAPLGRDAAGSLAVHFLQYAALYAVAFASYRWFEAPILRLKARFR